MHQSNEMFVSVVRAQSKTLENRFTRQTLVQPHLN